MAVLRDQARLLLRYFLLLCLLVLCSPAEDVQKSDAVSVEMHNVLYHFTDRIATHIRRLGGQLSPREPSGIPIFDDKRSFILEIHSAEIAISTEALANVLNHHVFSTPDAPLKDVNVQTVEGGKLKVTGKLHSKGDIGFETIGTIAPTADGKIRIHAEEVKAAHIPVKGLMDLFGVEVADLVKTNKVRGLAAVEDDLILDPGQALPPPQIAGRVTAVRVEGKQIIQTFGGKPDPPATRMRGNYMAYRGARLRFGKLTMNDTDLTLIDMDPKDPFDFYLDHCKEQLVAGYTKTTPSFGLHTYMRDYNKLQKSSPK